MYMRWMICTSPMQRNTLNVSVLTNSLSSGRSPFKPYTSDPLQPRNHRHNVYDNCHELTACYSVIHTPEQLMKTPHEPHELQHPSQKIPTSTELSEQTKSIFRRIMQTVRAHASHNQTLNRSARLPHHTLPRACQCTHVVSKVSGLPTSLLLAPAFSKTLPLASQPIDDRTTHREIRPRTCVGSMTCVQTSAALMHQSSILRTSRTLPVEHRSIRVERLTQICKRSCSPRKNCRRHHAFLASWEEAS